MQEPTGGRLAYPLCQLFNTLVKFIKYYHLISVNPGQNIWVGKVAIQNYNGTIQGHICTLMSKLTTSYFLQRSQMRHPVRLALIKYTQVEALYTYIILFETFIGSSKYEMATRQLWGS